MFLEQGTLDIIEGFIGWKWCVGEPKNAPRPPLFQVSTSTLSYLERHYPKVGAKEFYRSVFPEGH